MKLGCECIKELSSQEPEWLKQKRLEAFDAAKNLNFQNIFGLGISLNISDLDFNNIEPPKKENIKIDSDIEVLDIHEAIQKEDLKEYLFSTLEKDKVSYLHKAFFNKGLFIKVPKGVETKLYYEFDLKTKSSFDNVLIILEPLSKLEFIEKNIAHTDSGFRSQVVEIFAKEGSRIDYAAVQEYPHTINNFIQRKAIAEKDATVNWITCDLGGNISKADMTTVLRGPGSSTTTKNLFFGSGSQQFGLSVNAIHEASNTSSDLSTKGALNDKARGLYVGLIKILEQASNCTGYQKEDVLQLSEEAEANAIPNLEIRNEDVKCSHGATTGQVDKDKIFYLMSRGIPEQEAKNKIVEGFFEYLIAQIPIESLQEEIRNMIKKKL